MLVKANEGFFVTSLGKKFALEKHLNIWFLHLTYVFGLLDLCILAAIKILQQT